MKTKLKIILNGNEYNIESARDFYLGEIVSTIESICNAQKILESNPNNLTQH
jgi:hypothetical protein